MSRRMHVVGVVAIALGAAACTAISGEDPSASLGAEAGESALRITAHTETDISGSFEAGGERVAFEAHRTGPATATLHLEVNGQPFDASYDGGAMSARWNGYNGALYAGDLAALKRTLAALGEHFGGDQESLRFHEDFLVRRISFWSEAPAGLTMPERELDLSRPPGETLRVAPPGVTVFEEGDERAETGGIEVDHQGSDEDGIRYIRCNANSLATHDANGHCLQYESIFAGPNSNDCMGKCGGGCGFGTAGYTYDCLDHDRCGRKHGGSVNPWDAECGDEYWEADDDFFNSIIGRCL
ncbi:hypothetical protein [Sorangium sp. So ce233]|uniref:hypothetical protein n=1 Tax=Sorangium sp. So ce233 TaxID=3133290 RepID=UPI003F614200